MLHRKLNKLGTFNLSQLGKSKSPIAEFMRNARKNNDNFEESLLKLVRIARHIPVTPCCIRSWMLSCGCCCAHMPDHLCRRCGRCLRC